MVLWFTGLSGAGKTTIATRVAESLRAAGARVLVLDGDVIRKELTSHLGFSPQDIRENNRIIGEKCAEELPHFDYILVPVISPFAEARSGVRVRLGASFKLIYCRVALADVVARDPKGLYKKALNGEIASFIGVDPSVPYEAPEDADLILDTATESPDDSAQRVMRFIAG